MKLYNFYQAVFVHSDDMNFNFENFHLDIYRNFKTSRVHFVISESLAYHTGKIKKVKDRDEISRKQIQANLDKKIYDLICQR